MYGVKMFIEDLIEEYPEEIKALGIQTDEMYSLYELEELVNRCESYRERKELRERVEALEKRMNKLENNFRVEEE